jgi:glycosyltransferase involved in cell wall biosynthesis
MIKLASSLLPRYPNLRIVIVGGGSGLDQLQRQAHKLGVAEHCIFPGQVPYERVPYYINAFDVGISIDTSERVDNFGNSSQKIRQYIACGKPVVSSYGGNLFLEKEKLGSIINPDDTEQMAQVVDAWLSMSASDRNAHSRKAVDYAQKNLSVNKALNDRIEFWNSRLQEGYQIA